MKRILGIALYLILTITLFAEKSNVRIISLAPAVTEMIYYIGAEDNLIGVTTACDYPDGAKKKNKVGDFTMPDLEKIVMLKPDYVIGMDLNDKKLEKLKEFGIKSINFKVSKVEDIFIVMSKVNEIAGQGKNGEDKIEKLKARLKKVEMNIRSSTRPGVFIIIWNSPLMTAGKNTVVSSIVEAAGGRNIAEDAMGDYPEYSRELLLMRKPDYYLADPKVSAEIQGIKIDKKKIIRDINADYFFRPGPRVVDGIEKLHERFDKK